MYSAAASEYLWRRNAACAAMVVFFDALAGVRGADADNHGWDIIETKTCNRQMGS